MDSGYAHRESTTFRTCIWAIRRFHVSLCAVFIGSVRKFDNDTRISLSSSFFLLHSFFLSLIELFSRSMWQLLIAVIYTHAYLIFAWLSLRNAKLTRSTALARSLWLACIIVSSYFHHTYVTSLSLSLSLSFHQHTIHSTASSTTSVILHTRQPPLSSSFLAYRLTRFSASISNLKIQQQKECYKIQQ